MILYADLKKRGREDDALDELKVFLSPVYKSTFLYYVNLCLYLNLQDLLHDLSEDKDKIRVAKAHRTLGEALLMTDSYKDAAKHFLEFLRESQNNQELIFMITF